MFVNILAISSGRISAAIFPRKEAAAFLHQSNNASRPVAAHCGRDARAPRSSTWCEDSSGRQNVGNVGRDLRRVFETRARKHGSAKGLIPSSLLLSCGQDLRRHRKVIQIIHVDRTLRERHPHNRDTRTKHPGHSGNSGGQIQALERK